MEMLLILFLLSLPRAFLLLGLFVIKSASPAVMVASIILPEPPATGSPRGFRIACGLWTVLQCCLVFLTVGFRRVADFYCLGFSHLFLTLEFGKAIT